MHRGSSTVPPLSACSQVLEGNRFELSGCDLRISLATKNLPGLFYLLL